MQKTPLAGYRLPSHPDSFPIYMHPDSPLETEITAGSHAIVMGGSIAGLLVARVLAKHFKQVTLLERDQFPEKPEIRPGVPQSAHVHGLLLRGQQSLEQIFPGLIDDLKQEGALSLDWIQHWKFVSIWGLLEQHDSGLEGLCCSRLLIEWYLRQKLTQLTNFTLRSGCYVKGLQLDAVTQKRVTGIRFEDRADPASQEQSLPAALVVDATGRQSKLPQYLSSLGFLAPPETVVNSFLGYASRWYQRPPDLAVPESEQGIIISASPTASSRGGVLYPVEGDRWIVTLAGIAGDHPPGNEAGFMDFMQSLRDPLLYERLKDAEACSPIYCYRRTENQWRHYEKINLPAGLIALGDAVCCFNPVYGQGMTAAALGATTLDTLLSQRQSRSNAQKQSGRLEQDFTHQFQKKLATLVETPWLMATGEDFRWKETVGDRPGWVATQLQSYIDGVLKLSRVDSSAHRLFIEVAHLAKPPTALFSPRMLWKVLVQGFSDAGI